MSRPRPTTKKLREWCPHCGQGFYQFRDLAEHVKVKHKLTVHEYFGNVTRK